MSEYVEDLINRTVQHNERLLRDQVERLEYRIRDIEEELRQAKADLETSTQELDEVAAERIRRGLDATVKISRLATSMDRGYHKP